MCGSETVFKEEIQKYEKNILEDISRLVSCQSIYDKNSIQIKAPFGQGVRQAMDEFILIAKKLGFDVVDHDGYAISASLGNNVEHIGILGHLDVVDINSLEEWKSDPFVMSVRKGHIYGRGVNDDKGPLVAALYAAKIVYDSSNNLNRSIKVIAGGAEETSWECMDYYFKNNPQPIYAFSPDGNFPIVNGEMGILQIKLVFSEKTNLNFSSFPERNFVCYELLVDEKKYYGDKNLSRNPQRGSNAIFEFLNSKEYDQNFKNTNLFKFLNKYIVNDIWGKNLGIATKHEEMLPLTVCAMSLNSHKNTEILLLDVRYPINITKHEIMDRIKRLSNEYNFEVSILREMNPLFVNKNSDLIRALSRAYELVMNEKVELITKGGASYARVLDCGIAFGATFPGEKPNPHMPNENMSIKSLKKACEIYCHAIEELTK